MDYSTITASAMNTLATSGLALKNNEEHLAKCLKAIYKQAEKGYFSASYPLKNVSSSGHEMVLKVLVDKGFKVDVIRMGDSDYYRHFQISWNTKNDF